LTWLLLLLSTLVLWVTLWPLHPVMWLLLLLLLLK
jgi:hypothetical protein